MLDIIQYEDVKKYKKYIPFDICTNSRLYYDKDLIHKIFFYNTREFETILKKIRRIKIRRIG